MSTRNMCAGQTLYERILLPSNVRCGTSLDVSGVFIPHIVWLWNVVKAWGMYDFATAR